MVMVTAVHDRCGRAAAKTARTVLSGMVGLSKTQDSYFGRKVARTGAAEVLAIFADRTQSR
jgi:hypothetical protein